MWIFNGQYGVFNAVLRNLGIINSNISWLGHSGPALIAVILGRAWQVLPWYMAFLLAGLQGVPKTQIEAAKIDGAGDFKVFTNVVLPNMKFIIFLVLILGTIGNLQHFDIIWAMTGGGPGLATTTFAVEVYKRAFQNYNLGTAAAIGVLWVLVISIFAYFYLKNMSKE
jgi:multiple sugar transport system permease protein